MPVIKEYTSQYRASGEFGGRRASAEDFIGSGESSSFLDGLDLKKIGDATQDVAKYLYKEEEQREVTDLHVQMAKANADWSENMIERQKTAKPGDMGFATSVTQDMKGYFEEMGGNYKTKAGQQQFKLQSADMVSRYGIAAIKHQSALAGEYAKVQHAQLNEDLGRSAFNDPTQYESLRQQAARAIDDPKSNYANLDPASREELKLKTLSNIDLATVKGLATHSPEFLLGNVAPDVMARFKPVATALVKQGVLPKANFNDVLDTVSQAEGGYVNNPNDAGGETNRGISKRAYPNLDIKNLTKAQADKIYKEDYWDKIDGDKLPPATALVAMHVAVMSGVGRANTYLKESGGDPQKMIDMQRDFLTSLAKNPKRNDAQFYNGWMKRMDTLTANVSTMPSVSNLPIEEVVQQQDKTPAKVGIAAFDNLSWKEQYETIHTAEQTIRTNRTFDNNARVEAERAKVEAQNASMNNYLNRILDNDATVARDLRSDKVLTFAQREHVLNTINVRAGKMDNTDSGVFIDTFKGIHDGTITSDTQINALMGRGLSITDVNRLRNELVGKNQPMGEVRKQFYKMAEAQISKSSMIAKDPEGEAQLYKWTQYVESVVAEKTKEGVSMNRLFNPNDKEYLGWTINGFVRGPKQQMSDMASRMKGAPPQPAMGQTVLPRPSLDQIFSGKP